MRTRYIILAVALVTILILAVVWFFTYDWFHEDPVMISISTDKQDYRVGETVRVNITSYDHVARDLYCPMQCALGNFPTTVEKYVNYDVWETLAVFCPSIEPLFGNYETKGDYIIHTLEPGDSYDIELSNFEALHIHNTVRLKIVYYMNAGRSTLLSPEFTMRP